MDRALIEFRKAAARESRGRHGVQRRYSPALQAQAVTCRCNGAVVTAPGPAQILPGSRYAPELASAWRSRSTPITCPWNDKSR